MSKSVYYYYYFSWFRSYSEGDYARSGNTSTETIHLPAGPLTMFPHNLEPYLRELGLPTTLEKGIIYFFYLILDSQTYDSEMPKIPYCFKCK